MPPAIHRICQSGSGCGDPMGRSRRKSPHRACWAARFPGRSSFPMVLSMANGVLKRWLIPPCHRLVARNSAWMPLCLKAWKSPPGQRLGLWCRAIQRLICLSPRASCMVRRARGLRATPRFACCRTPSLLKPGAAGASASRRRPAASPPAARAWHGSGAGRRPVRHTVVRFVHAAGVCGPCNWRLSTPGTIRRGHGRNRRRSADARREP